MGSALSSGAKLGRYEIRSQLGVGGMGGFTSRMISIWIARSLLKVLPEMWLQIDNACSVCPGSESRIRPQPSQTSSRFMKSTGQARTSWLRNSLDGENLRHHLRRAP